MYAPWLTAASVVFIVVGVFIFMTQRYLDAEADREFGRGRNYSPIPRLGDIFNYSGQQTGGRREESPFDHSDGGGGDGGGGD